MTRLLLLSLLSGCTYLIDFEDPEDTDTGEPGDTGLPDDTAGDSGTDTGADTGTAALLTTEWTLAEGEMASWVWAHDVTGDGEQDILAASVNSAELIGVDGRPMSLHFIRAGGGDRYYPLTTTPLDHGFEFGFEMSFGDVNEDGIDDVAIGHSDGFSLYYGGPTGLDGPHEIAGDNALGVVLADLDLDGHLDAVACSPAGELLTFTGAGDGSFTLSARAECAETSATRPRDAVADLDGDGSPDFVRRVLYGSNPTDTLEVSWNNGGIMADGQLYGFPADGMVARGTAIYDFGIVQGTIVPTPYLVLPVLGGDSLNGYTLSGRELAFGYGLMRGPSEFSSVLVGDADGDGVDDVVIPYTAGGDGTTTWNEASYYKNFGAFAASSYPGEWEMKNNLTNVYDHGYDLLESAPRSGLHPLVMTRYTVDAVAGIVIVEAEAEL